MFKGRNIVKLELPSSFFSVASVLVGNIFLCDILRQR